MGDGTLDSEMVGLFYFWKTTMPDDERARPRVATLDVDAFRQGPICADFDEDCAGWTPEQYARCAQLYDVGPCPYLKKNG